MFNLIAIPLGWIMRLIYQVVQSYGVSIIIFTILIKLITLPSTYKMQVNSARMGLLTPKLEKLKKSFANNPTRLQEEQTKLYSQEGINPGSGCLGSLLTMILLLGVYQVVLKPLTHILRLGSSVTEATNLLSAWLDEHQITERYLATRPELILLKYAKTNPEIFSSIEGFSEKLNGFRNSFLGFDLAGVPTMHPDGGWNITAFLLVMLPILAAIAQLALTIVSQYRSKQTNPAAQSMGAMNAMLYLSPLMTIWIGMSVPAGLSFYWLANSLLSLVMMLLIYKYLTGDRLAAINEKEKQKQLAKGPGWMQRMMEASAQYANEQNGTVSRPDANRTRYADGDDGMSRKERAEYERKLIEAARRRAALKYGEELPDDGDLSDEE